MVGQVQQLQQQVATYQARETQAAAIMQQQKDELERLQEKLAAATLEASENINLVHRAVSLEGELAECQKKLTLRDEQLRKATEELLKQKQGMRIFASSCAN